MFSGAARADVCAGPLASEVQGGEGKEAEDQVQGRGGEGEEVQKGSEEGEKRSISRRSTSCDDSKIKLSTNCNSSNSLRNINDSILDRSEHG